MIPHNESVSDRARAEATAYVERAKAVAISFCCAVEAKDSVVVVVTNGPALKFEVVWADGMGGVMGVWKPEGAMQGGEAIFPEEVLAALTFEGLSAKA